MKNDSIRDTIQSFPEETVTITSKVDPECGISGLQKALEGGPIVLFERIKGFPGTRAVGNVFARRERIARIFDTDDYQQLKLKCLNAIRNPIAPRVVDDAPCQEVVITKDINVRDTIPILKHSERDADRILGGGIILLTGEYAHNGTEVSFKRMRFRQDWATITFGLTTHTEQALTTEFRGRKVPLTINIAPPPAVMVAAATGYVHSVVPFGSDEMGIAGAVQGSPVEMVKAKTVDAYACAQSEWVIEGYVDTTKKEWETEEAEKIGRSGVAPFFPEWHGYLGRAYRNLTFQATAITHRKDSPIFYDPLARSIDADVMAGPLREACFLEMAERIAPGLVIDVNIIPGIASWSAFAVFQVCKRRRRDEGVQRTILINALAASPALQLAIVVDEDINVNSAEDLLWAIITRTDSEDFIRSPINRGLGVIPIERIRPGTGVVGGGSEFFTPGGLAIDATVPFEQKAAFERAHYPSYRIDLKEWLSDADISKAKSLQSALAKYLAATGR